MISRRLDYIHCLGNVSIAATCFDPLPPPGIDFRSIVLVFETIGWNALTDSLQ